MHAHNMQITAKLNLMRFQRKSLSIPKTMLGFFIVKVRARSVLKAGRTATLPLVTDYQHSLCPIEGSIEVKGPPDGSAANWSPESPVKQKRVWVCHACYKQETPLEFFRCGRAGLAILERLTVKPSLEWLGFDHQAQGVADSFVFCGLEHSADGFVRLAGVNDCLDRKSVV